MKMARSVDQLAMPEVEIERLERHVREAMLVDQPRLRRALTGLRRRGRAARDGELARIAARLERSVARCARRRGAVPVVAFPEALPVSAARHRIVELVDAHSVVIVSGATGSGKSTQLPKICLAAGRGVAGTIAVTEPRRIAARSVAERIAGELAVPIGKQVGFRVRFGRYAGRESLIKIMTDGILLAEIQSDPDLVNYDTVVVDEVHERSLNVDFLLGYLRRLIGRRPELKLVLASATIDTERFASFFGGAPVVDVEGRSYPVEVRYRAPPDPVEQDIPERVGAAVVDLCSEGAGDVLVFLAGEREIHDTTAYLRRARLAGVELLELYARVPFAAQQRVFGKHAGRRVVLATNIAETSITVPGIRYVIDAGRARVSRYAARSGLQRLPIEPISRAAAEQRKGRCGRLGPGICVRLYSEEDYAARPEYTEPEIRRTNLAAVLLRMRALGCGDPADFPFLDPPESTRINDGLRLLVELGALGAGGTLTDIGRSLARLPVEPRIGRMLLAGAELNCLEDILVVAGALSIPDPRETPPGSERAALAARAEYADKRSDFVTLLNLWRDFRRQLERRDGERLYAFCRRRFLSPTRMREWLDVHAQLNALARELKIGGREQQPASYAQLHRALLSGLLRNVGARAEQGEYAGLRDTHFTIARGSVLYGSHAQFIVAAEIIDTGRAHAYRVASVRPEWVERTAGVLLRREHFDAYWDERRGVPMVHERTTVYGLTLVARRRVRYAPVSQRGAHEMFIAALVREQVGRPNSVLRANRALVEELRGFDDKLRRPDAVLSEARIRAFYAERIPESVSDARTFDAWRRRTEQQDPNCLRMVAADVRHTEPPPGMAERFPDALRCDGLPLRLGYRFAPGADDDGVTMTVPQELLLRLEPEHYEWLVPGLLEEKVTALLRRLSKDVRRELAPLAETVAGFMAHGGTPSGSLVAALRSWLLGARGVRPGASWSQRLTIASGLAPHLCMRFRVIDRDGRVLATGRDLVRLQRLSNGQPQVPPAPAGAGRERFGLRDWPSEGLPREVPDTRADGRVVSYPALVDEGQTVALCLLASSTAAREATRAGLRRLYLLRLARHSRGLLHTLDGLAESELIYATLPEAPTDGLETRLGPVPKLREALLAHAVSETFELDRDRIRSRTEFEVALVDGRSRYAPALHAIYGLCREILDGFRRVRALRNDAALRVPAESLVDIDSQLAHLCFRGCLAAYPSAVLMHYPRYLHAARMRLERLLQGGADDLRRTRRVAPQWARYLARAGTHRVRGREDPELRCFRWMVEEFRVSLFAQELGTEGRISVQRLDAQWRKVAG